MTTRPLTKPRLKNGRYVKRSGKVTSVTPAEAVAAHNSKIFVDASPEASQLTVAANKEDVNEVSS